MVFVPPRDRVLERSTSNSQSVFALTGAIDTSYNAFSASMAIGDTTIGGVVEAGVAFKSGILTYSAAGEITVTTVKESKGTFSAGGVKDVFMGQPASVTLMVDGVQALSQDQKKRGRENLGLLGSTSLLALSISEFTSAYVTTGQTFADGFKSTGMVDTAGATNLDVAENSYLKPGLVTGSYNTQLTVTTTGDAGGYSGFTIVQTIAAAQVGVTGTGIVEVTFAAASAEDLFIGTPYLGHVKPSGNGYEFETAPVTMTVNGSNTITANTTRTATASFTIQAGKALAIAWYCGGSTSQDGLKRRNTATSGLASWIKSANESSVVAKAGFASDSPVSGVTLLRFAPQSVGNVTVASQVIPIGFQPSVVSGSLRLVPTDAITLNTDVIFEMSRDNGVTWTAATLTLDFTDGGVSVLKIGDVSLAAQPAGSQPKWRIRSANTKNFKVDGVALDFAA